MDSDDGAEAIEKELGTEAMTAEQQEEKSQLKAERDTVGKYLLGMRSVHCGNTR